MKKDIEWLVQMINAERETLRQRIETGRGTPNENTFNEGRDRAFAYVLRMIQHLDKPEVLSQELPVLPKYVAEYLEFAKSDVPLKRVMEIANVRDEWPKWRREYDWISVNDEAFARAWLDGYEVEEELLYHAMVKGHKLLVNKNASVYWNYDTTDNDVFLSNLDSEDGRYLNELSKEEWREFGINDSNADFVKVHE